MRTVHWFNFFFLLDYICNICQLTFWNITEELQLWRCFDPSINALYTVHVLHTLINTHIFMWFQSRDQQLQLCFNIFFFYVVPIRSGVSNEGPPCLTSCNTCVFEIIPCNFENMFQQMVEFPTWITTSESLSIKINLMLLNKTIYTTAYHPSVM